MIDTTGHHQFTDESGTWCWATCPRPEEECGALALQQNDSYCDHGKGLGACCPSQP